jgi:hypothetical protein
LLVPVLNVTADRIQGCAPWLVRMLTLFSFSRCVAVDRRLRHVIVETRHLWWWRRTHLVGFDRIERIVYRAQLMPSFSLRFTSSEQEPSGRQAAVFFIGLALRDARQELHLFTVWERQPGSPGLLESLAGMRHESTQVGDEASVRIATLLHEYLGVPISA